MLHLVYYLKCLTQVEDVRSQNRDAFELGKLQSLSPMEIISNYYNNNQQQQMLLQGPDEARDEDVILEENEETHEYQS